MVSGVFKIVKIKGGLFSFSAQGGGLIYFPLDLAGKIFTLDHHFKVFGNIGHHTKISDFFKGTNYLLFPSREGDGEPLFYDLCNFISAHQSEYE
jgi:hypothetical protein